MNRMSEQTRREAGRSETYASTCPACGAAARRTDAHFCATCGRGLREPAYAPADSLLASYHQQHHRPAILFEPEMRVAEPRKPRFRLPPSEGNTSAAIAVVMVLCSLFPLYGIMFIPFVVVFGGFGLLEAWLFCRMGGARLAVTCIVFGLLIAGAQGLVSLYILSYF